MLATVVVPTLPPWLFPPYKDVAFTLFIERLVVSTSPLILEPPNILLAVVPLILTLVESTPASLPPP